MRDLWTLLDETCPGSIPPGIIFLPGKRLSLSGFGWAPRTWMSGQEVDYPDPLSNMVSAARLVPGMGLLVEYPGFLLHAKSPNTILWPNQRPIQFPSDSTLLDWYEVEQAEDMKKSETPKGTIMERPEQFAIILCRPKPRELPEIALLVRVGREIIQRGFGGHRLSKVYQVRIVCRVRIKRELGVDHSARWKEFTRQSEKEEDKFICGEVLDSNQKWYVDGQQDLPKSSATGTRPSAEPPKAVAAPTTPRSQNGRETPYAMLSSPFGMTATLQRWLGSNPTTDPSGTSWSANDGASSNGNVGMLPKRTSTFAIGDTSGSSRGTEANPPSTTPATPQPGIRRSETVAHPGEGKKRQGGMRLW